MKAVRYFGWAVLLALVCTGCRREAVPGIKTEAVKHRRIVVLAPAAAEMIDALGLGSDIVGAGDFVQWPLFTQQLPKVGAYQTPSVEAILALNADLLVTARSQAGSSAHQRLRTLGVEVIELETSTYAGVLSSVRLLGKVLGREKEAASLVKKMEAEVDDIRRLASGLPRRKVLFAVGRDPLYVAGPGSHVNEMIEVVGGENVAHDAGAPYQLMSFEVALERLPEVIIDTSDNRPGALRGMIAGVWGKWDFLPAIKENKVYWVDPVRLVIPGIRLPEMTRLMGKLIHPEVFGKPAADEFGSL